MKKPGTGLAMVLLAAMSSGIAPCAARAVEAPPHAQAQPASSSAPGAAERHARKHARDLTLEQAVARVQNQTGGKVLKADSRNLGRFTEYRIKVLTPEGHVRVVTLRSDARGN